MGRPARRTIGFVVDPDKLLVAQLQLAHAGELAAGYAYRGHWRSVRDPEERERIHKIEDEEWHHRRLVAGILRDLGAKPRPVREAVFWTIGRTLGTLCHAAGWFLPMYAAGRLERRNIVEYEDAAVYARASGHPELLDCLAVLPGQGSGSSAAAPVPPLAGAAAPRDDPRSVRRGRPDRRRGRRRSRTVMNGPNRGTWLVSARWDVGGFGGSALLAFGLLLFGRLTGALHGAVPAWAWIATVVFVDVAHVWATAYRVYLDPDEMRRRPALYLGLPLAAYAAGVALYSAGSASLFWRVLAYVAVLHFVRQQYGWVALYRRRLGVRSALDRVSTRSSTGTRTCRESSSGSSRVTSSRGCPGIRPTSCCPSTSRSPPSTRRGSSSSGPAGVP